METNLSEQPKSPILDHCLKTLRDHEAKLQAIGVLHAAVFGAVARGEDTEKSAIRLVVTIQDGIGFGVCGIVCLEYELAEVFGRKVEVVDIGGLRPDDEQIRKDMVRAF